MKIEITPASLSDYRMRNAPATLTISIKGIFINKKAVSVLAAKIGDRIGLEFEDGVLYHSNSSEGFRISAELKSGMMAQAGGLRDYIDTFFKKGHKSYTFSIGEFKIGRRPLTLIEK